MCQKVINVIAIASGVVSLAVVGVGGYVYVNQESIIESVKEKALGSIGGAALGGALIWLGVKGPPRPKRCAAPPVADHPRGYGA